MPLPLQPPSPPPILNGGPLSSMTMSMGGMHLNGMGVPIRPLPAIPTSVPEMTSLSPPPRRNSKQLVVVPVTADPPTAPTTKISPPRTPKTPSIFEGRVGAESLTVEEAEQLDEDIVSTFERETRLPHMRTTTFGTPPPALADKKDTQKQIPLLLSLPPSPLLQPTQDEQSATPPDTPSYEASGMSPSSPASIFSLGTMSH
ncbi:hypothetical protein AN958_07649 [Leucoagaricus sp. SymC.cos]|nr:hypothetical protein AN958_07649 [Leucoagaricus sp. SymC.cos]